MKGPSLYRSPLNKGTEGSEGPMAPPTPAFYKSPLESACTPDGCPANEGPGNESGNQQEIKKQESIKTPDQKTEEKKTEGDKKESEEIADENNKKKEQTDEAKISAISAAGSMLAS